MRTSSSSCLRAYTVDDKGEEHIVMFGESLGMIARALGLLTRFAAISLIVIIAGAFFVDHAQHGFYMNWFGQNTGEGYEYDILVAGAAAAIAVLGAGRYSTDNWIGKPRAESIKHGARA